MAIPMPMRRTRRSQGTVRMSPMLAELVCSSAPSAIASPTTASISLISEIGIELWNTSQKGSLLSYLFLWGHKTDTNTNQEATNTLLSPYFLGERNGEYGTI